jgi:hypothetical protein
MVGLLGPILLVFFFFSFMRMLIVFTIIAGLIYIPTITTTTVQEWLPFPYISTNLNFLFFQLKFLFLLFNIHFTVVILEIGSCFLLRLAWTATLPL